MNIYPFCFLDEYVNEYIYLRQSSKYKNTYIHLTNTYWALGTVLGFADMMLNKLD